MTTSTTSRTPGRLVVALAVAIGLAGCGGDDGAADADDPGDASTPAATEDGSPVDEQPDDAADGSSVDDGPVEDEPAEDEPADDGADDGGGATTPVTTAETDLGEVLVTDDGMTVYGFTQDEQGGPSACTGDCLEAWPPVLVDGDAVPPGLDPDVFGVLDRADGEGVQLTANGWPLYLYAADEAPGDTTGQGVGDVWWVVAPDGELLVDGGDEGTSGDG